MHKWKYTLGYILRSSCILINSWFHPNCIRKYNNKPRYTNLCLVRVHQNLSVSSRVKFSVIFLVLPASGILSGICDITSDVTAYARLPWLRHTTFSLHATHRNISELIRNLCRRKKKLEIKSWPICYQLLCIQKSVTIFLSVWESFSAAISFI